MIETIIHGLHGMDGQTVMAICAMAGVTFAAVVTSILVVTSRNPHANLTPPALTGAAAALEAIRCKTEWERKRLRELKEEIERREEEDREGAR